MKFSLIYSGHSCSHGDFLTFRNNARCSGGKHPDNAKYPDFRESTFWGFHYSVHYQAALNNSSWNRMGSPPKYFSMCEKSINLKGTIGALVFNIVTETGDNSPRRPGRHYWFPGDQCHDKDRRRREPAPPKVREKRAGHSDGAAGSRNV